MLYDTRWELDEAGKVLWEAADLLEREGWTQCCSQNGKGERCVMWAILDIEKDMAGWMRSEEVRKRLRDAIGRPDPVGWNDTAGRTKEQVVDALRRAAREVPAR